MKLGTEVGLGPGHNVLEGIQLSLKGHTPNFPPMSVVDQDATWYGGGVTSAQATLCMGIQLLRKRAQLPIFGHVYGSQTVAHLSYC